MVRREGQGGSGEADVKAAFIGKSRGSTLARRTVTPRQIFPSRIFRRRWRWQLG